MKELDCFLNKSASRHSRLCPRQVLGVRMGLAGADWLGLEIPCKDKRLLTILETDGCFADGIEAATGCTVGHRTLRVEDYGKVAATFIDVKTGKAVRSVPRNDVRKLAFKYAPEQKNRYKAQLYGYQIMPADELFSFQEVVISTPLEVILGQPGQRANCSYCGEEILNGRENDQNGKAVCRACTGPVYYNYPISENWSSKISLVERRN